MITKFKITEKLVLQSTQESVIVKKVIRNFGNNTVKYLLDNGLIVGEQDLLNPSDAKKITKTNQKIEKKEDEKSGLPPVEDVDLQADNKSVKKSPKKKKNDPGAA